MCVVSAVGDQWSRDFPNRWPSVPVYPQPYVTPPSEIPHQFEPTQDALPECVYCGHAHDHWIHAVGGVVPQRKPEISKKDFDALKAEVEELRELLLAAKRFDEATGQPDCEMDEKVELIRQIADLVGVDVDEVFGSRGDGTN